MIKLRVWMLLLALFCCAGSARADTCSASMTDVVFGTVSPVAGSDYYATGTLSITCTATLGSLGTVLLPTAAICVNLGVGTGGTAVTARAMANGSSRMPFNLYRDSTYAASSIWGSTATAGTAQPVTTSMIGLLGLGSNTVTTTIYAKIPASSLAGVPTSGGSDTTYTADFAGAGTIQYYFAGLLAPAGDCVKGSSATFSFKATASVTNNCFINTNALAFGTNRLLTSPVRTTGSMTVQCTAGNPYQVALSGGSTGKVAARRMLNNVSRELIAYEISASLDGPLWGDGTNGTSMVTGTGSGALQTLRLYGRVPAQRTPTPGDYKDTVTATIYF